MQRLQISIIILVVLLSATTSITGQNNRIVRHVGNININDTTYRFIISEEYDGNDLVHKVILNPESPVSTEISGVRHSNGEWGEMKFCAPHFTLDFDIGCVMSNHTRQVWTGNTEVYRGLNPIARGFMVDKLNRAIDYGLKEKYLVQQ